MSNTAWADALAEAENPEVRNPEAWARSFAEAGGDESKAKALYVQRKVGATASEKPAYCPNCTSECRRDAKTCQKCGADFVNGGWSPRDVRPKNAAYGASLPMPSHLTKASRSRGIYIILALFFGLLGIHNFYIGRLGVGLAQLLITVILGWFVIGIVITFLWCLADMFTVTKDGAGDPLS